MKIDPASLATGYRTSKVVGSTVVNETNETVGTIDDLIVTPGDKVPFAVLSVGGFLGMGTKYVVVPYNSLQVRDSKMVLTAATKDSLKSLPEFKALGLPQHPDRLLRRVILPCHFSLLRSSK